MCFVILVSKDSGDRSWEWKEIGREEEEDRAKNSAMAWITRDDGDEHYPSETTLVLKMKDGME